jgi:hypothetical protein
MYFLQHESDANKIVLTLWQTSSLFETHESPKNEFHKNVVNFVQIKRYYVSRYIRNMVVQFREYIAEEI